jgi:hypothetical protein
MGTSNSTTLAVTPFAFEVITVETYHLSAESGGQLGQFQLDGFRRLSNHPGFSEVIVHLLFVPVSPSAGTDRSLRPISSDRATQPFEPRFVRR